MKCIIDAQFPYKLAILLRENGIDTLHTDDLPRRERTSDETITRLAEREERVVITKDTDFLDSYLVQGIPSRLLLITTGNIANKQLFSLMKQNLEHIVELFSQHTFLELSNDRLTVHE